MSAAIERVGVIGAGQMGSGIAEVSAKAGAEVVVYRADRRAGDSGPRSPHPIAGACGEQKAS